MPTTNTATITMVNLLVPFKLPSTSDIQVLPKTQASSQISKSWPRPYTPVPLSCLGALGLVLRGGLGWNKAEEERENKQDHKKRTQEIAEEERKREEEENATL